MEKTTIQITTVKRNWMEELKREYRLRSFDEVLDKIKEVFDAQVNKKRKNEQGYLDDDRN